MASVNVRFAPSPTGPLHIGGVRTALYNYLFAKKHGGNFILRIEDTDQNRYVEGAEDYIVDALNWLGLEFDHSPAKGGPKAPYRQSERKEFYAKYAQQLVDSGNAYYAFDTAEELDKWRDELHEKGIHTPKYDSETRQNMRNSEALSKEEVEKLLENETPYVIRFKIDPGQEITFNDEIRGEVTFNTDDLDDKVLMKTDGLPTYHLANIVDDHLMEISHVIRGEEWLPSTPLHVLLYRAFGWADTMPKFAHLPLILKPVGNGKLSKRDGAKFGFPVFPLSWEGASEEESFIGFKEFGFDAGATLNFLAFLGWNPGTEQEIFDLDGLIEAFSVEHIVKSGARFDIEKAKWYNQQYIIHQTNEELIPAIKEVLVSKDINWSDKHIAELANMMKERVVLYPDFYSEAAYLFGEIPTYDTKTLKKKWKGDNVSDFQAIRTKMEALDNWTMEDLSSVIKSHIQEHSLSFGNILPLFRIATTGTTKGPDVFEMMAFMGKEQVMQRLNDAEKTFEGLISE